MLWEVTSSEEVGEDEREKGEVEMRDDAGEVDGQQRQQAGGRWLPGKEVSSELCGVALARSTREKKGPRQQEQSRAKDAVAEGRRGRGEAGGKNYIIRGAKRGGVIVCG